LKFRNFLAEIGVTRQELQVAGQLDDSFEEASFLTRLREFLSHIREISKGRIGQIVLVLDEFDKLLEHYRKGFQSEVEDLTNQLRRAATEEVDIGLILAGSDLMRNVIEQYRNALYGSSTTIELNCFDQQKDRSSVRAIIAPPSLKGRRLFSEAVLDDIIRITGGHPLYMRLVACTASWITQRKRISRGIIIEAVYKLVRNEALKGYLPDPPNLIKQPLQSLNILSLSDQPLAEILLLQIARYTTLERPWTTWGTISHDDRLLNLRPLETWTRIRDEIRVANIIIANESRQWGFRFPILGEGLRTDLDIEFERLQTEISSNYGVES
jgi:hypothetical protein